MAIKKLKGIRLPIDAYDPMLLRAMAAIDVRELAKTEGELSLQEEIADSQLELEDMIKSRLAAEYSDAQATLVAVERLALVIGEDAVHALSDDHPRALVDLLRFYDERFKS